MQRDHLHTRIFIKTEHQNTVGKHLLASMRYSSQHAALEFSPQIIITL